MGHNKEYSTFAIDSSMIKQFDSMNPSRFVAYITDNALDKTGKIETVLETIF